MAKDSIKALLIEQSGDLREATARVLRSEGYQIAHLPEGSDPVAFIETIRPQVIVVRLQPLVPWGQHVIESLQKDPRTRDIPVVLISALEQDVQAVAAFPNVREILAIPFSLTSLRAAVARAVEKPPSDVQP